MSSSFSTAAVPAAPSFRDARLPVVRQETTWFGDVASSAPERGRDAVAALLAMRQLCHHTKDALQRTLDVPAAVPDAVESEWIEDAARRIRPSSDISDTLFGFTQAPGPMQGRLQTLADVVVALMAIPGQTIDVRILVDGDCPLGLRGAVIQVAREFVGNAIRYGLHARAEGTIRIELSCQAGSQVRLLVSDDGCGLATRSRPGEGLGTAGAMALRLGGTVTLRQCRMTEAELVFPPRSSGWSARS